MAKINIYFNNKTYSIEESALANTIAALEVHFVEMGNRPSLMAPGLYETGTTTLLYSWDELIANNMFYVSPGADIDLPEKNEYGFYFGVPYSWIIPEDPSLAITAIFNADGSWRLNNPNGEMDMPTAVYSNGMIDVSAAEMGTLSVSNDGMSLVAEDGMTLSIGAGSPPKGMLYKDAYAIPLPQGDLIILNDGSVIAIGGSAFAYEAITSVVIPDSVIEIGIEAFKECNVLTKVTIGNGVTSIGDKAFYNCSSLQGITFEGTMDEWHAISKGSDWSLGMLVAQIYCTDGTVDYNLPT